LVLDEVEVAGLEGDELTPAEAGVDGGLDHQPVLCRDGGEDGVVLGGCQRPCLLLDQLGQLGVGAGVESDHAITERALEDRGQHGVVLPHRRSGETALEGCGDPALDFGGHDLATVSLKSQVRQPATKECAMTCRNAGQADGFTRKS
jgi:hypothetical protein